MNSGVSTEVLMKLKHAWMGYGDARCYKDAMAEVEAHRDLMLRELSAHGKMSLSKVVQFVADGMDCSFDVGGRVIPWMTFDESLYAIYAWNSNYWRWHNWHKRKNGDK